jgi:hypothetical protein
VLTVEPPVSQLDEGDMVPAERGTFRWRVDRAVVGPPHKELTLGYMRTDSSSFSLGVRYTATSSLR